MEDRFRWRSLLLPRYLLPGCGVLVTAVAIAAAYPLITGRSTPPALLALESRRAVDRARDAGAETFVPDLLGEAQDALRAGRAEARRQEARWPLFRDFREARGGFEQAVGAAKRAEEAARLARNGAQLRAEARLAEAVRRWEQVVALTEGLRLEAAESGALRAARLKLDEARLLAESGRYGLIGRLTEDALAHLREGTEQIGARAARYVDERHVDRWRDWEEATIAWSRDRDAAAIVVNKERNRLVLYVGGKPAQTFHADLGQSHFDAKLYAEDGATPEGRYRVLRKKGKGRSVYYKALEIDYPNKSDVQRHAEAVRSGSISRGVGAGNLIEIHGDGGRGEDWTRGCVALSNRDMDSIYDAVDIGTPVTIIGGDGDGGRFSAIAAQLTARPGRIDGSAAD